MNHIVGVLALLSTGCVAVHRVPSSDDSTSIRGLVQPHTATALVLGGKALDIADEHGVPATVRDGSVLVQVGGRYQLQPMMGGVGDPAAFWAVQSTFAAREDILSARPTPPVVVVGDPAITARIVGLEVKVDQLDTNINELGAAVLGEE